ncbi:MAG TPA: DNA recombination protein RmuC, partial [Burkholderiaceae bacterium]
MDFALPIWILLALCALNLLLLALLLLRRPPLANHAELLTQMAAINERVERELRREIGDSARGGRQELGQAFAAFQQTVVQQSAEATRTQNTQ